jgi:biopolymer transport protein ExbB
VNLLYAPFESIQIFLERGGDVLYLIMGVTFLMWVLIIERFWYFRAIFKKDKGDVLTVWENRKERKSWYAHKIRIALISQVRQNMNQNVGMIKTLVAICPLVGLLGTVTGMIDVFEIVALLGSGNARAMASGVSKATIPTMSGMVAALSGLFIVSYLERKVKHELDALEDSLTMEH